MTQEEIANYQMSFFVDYELAKELREKGFNMPCLGFYLINRFCFNDELDDGCNQSDYSINSQLDSHFVAAPTIDQVIEWLIEKYDTHIFTEYDNFLQSWHALKHDIYFNDTEYVASNFKTRKEAQLSGIKHALTLIK